MIPPENLLRDLPDARGGEVAETLLAAPGLRIERIVSLGQASPPGFWYDQDQAEWVLLLAGRARLRFADEQEDRMLGPGDFVQIALHRKHRVEWTDPAVPTVWLAVFHGAAAAPPPLEPGARSSGTHTLEPDRLRSKRSEP